jgi:hypothetical protein
MRDDESLLVDDALPIQNQVEVEGASRTWMRTHAPEALFDVEQGVEELARGQRGAAGRRGIQKARLITDDANGDSVVKA